MSSVRQHKCSRVRKETEGVRTTENNYDRKVYNAGEVHHHSNQDRQLSKSLQRVCLHSTRPQKIPGSVVRTVSK